MYQEDEERIAKRAYEIWEQEGRPEGRAEAHWDMAREEIAVRDNLAGTLKPNPATPEVDRTFQDSPVEPIEAVENLGEVPGLTDQGEEQQYPQRRARRG